MIKKYKKMLSVLLSLVLMFSLAVPVYAEETTILEFSASAETVQIGEEFTVSANITQNTGFNAFDMQLSYDDEVVEFLGFESQYDEDYGEDVLVSDFSTGSLIAFNDVTGYVTLARTNDSKKTGTLFTAKFKAIGEGNSNIAYVEEKLNMTSGNGEKVSLTVNTDAAACSVVTTPSYEGYQVSLTPGEQEKIVGETAIVKVNVESLENGTFNSVYTKLTYDSNYLTFINSDVSEYSISDSNGILTVIGYGEDKELGDVIELQFRVVNKPSNGTEVTLTQANLDVSENALVQNAPEATYGAVTAKIFVSGLSVTYPESDFTGDYVVSSGENYTFTAKDKNYNYTFNATMDGVEVEVIDNGDGSYTVENVTADLVIVLASKVAKTFDVVVEGALEDQFTGDSKASYMEDYVFTLNDVNGYTTQLSITINDEAYALYSVVGNTYTIHGSDILGEVKIIISNIEAEHEVIVCGDAAGSLEYENAPIHGKDFTFTINAEDGYTYLLSATMNGVLVDIIDNGDGTYTIKNVTDSLVITVDKEEVAKLIVEVAEYLKLDEKTVYLVTASKENLPEGSVFAYDGKVMYWSEEYQAYAYLVFASDEPLTAETAAEYITEVSAEATVIDYSGDVNGTNVIDVNDAQLVYDIYNAKYDEEDVTENVITMEKLLNADVNADKLVDSTDAAAIVNKILGN